MEKGKQQFPDSNRFLQEPVEHKSDVQNTHKDEVRTLQSLHLSHRKRSPLDKMQHT